MTGGQNGARQPMSTRKKALIGLGVAVCAPAFIAGAVHGAIQSDTPAVTAPSRAAATAATAAASPNASAPATAQATKRVAPEPTFTYPGDPQCAITYRDRGDGSMSWTATTTVGGELKTHVGTKSGSLYTRDTQTTPGPNAFAAPVPLAQIDDIGGVLFAPGTSYACSIAPQR
jgi:hypothetical protein